MVWWWSLYPWIPGLLQWRRGNHVIVPVACNLKTTTSENNDLDPMRHRLFHACLNYSHLKLGATRFAIYRTILFVEPRWYHHLHDRPYANMSWRQAVWDRRDDLLRQKPISVLFTTKVKGIKSGCPCIVEIRAHRAMPWSDTPVQG